MSLILSVLKNLFSEPATMMLVSWTFFYSLFIVSSADQVSDVDDGLLVNSCCTLNLMKKIV